MIISPTRMTVRANPGKSVVVIMDVTNDTRATTTILSEAESYRIDDRGRPIFGTHEPFELWTRVSSVHIPLGPGQQAPLSFIIDVPASAEPGNYSLALFAREIAQTNRQISVGVRSGSLLTLEVGGQREEYLVITKFFTRGIHWSLPISIEIEVENQGTVTAIPRGTVGIKSFFGGSRSFSINSEEKVVVPDSTWRETYRVQRLSLRDIGPIQFTASIEESGDISAEATVAAWYFPFELFFLVGFIFCLVFIAVRKTRQTIKRRKDV